MTTVEEPTSDKYQALLDHYRRHGSLTPPAVVAEARDASSPLHDAFTWDDQAAAEAHRLDQARSLIQRYRVKIVTANDEVVRVRAFVMEPERESYAPTIDVAADPDRRAAEVLRIRAEYAALAVKARAFEEFAALVQATEQLTG